MKLPEIISHNRRKLQQLMKNVDISNYRQLAQISGLSEREFFRIEYGLITKLTLDKLLKISQALQISLAKLIEELAPEVEPVATDNSQQLQQEYQRLQQQLATQKETLYQEFQKTTIHKIESWLLQWATAKAMVEKNADLPASKIIPLVKPLEQLLKGWGIEAIAAVGDEIAYDPQLHQLIGGAAQPGDLVKVRYVGYRQKDKLLYRAKVSPL